MATFGALAVKGCTAKLTAPKDAYCILWIPDLMAKPIQSKTAPKGSTPAFDIKTPLVLKGTLQEQTVLEVVLKDKRIVGSDEMLGKVLVPLGEIVRGQRGVQFQGQLDEGSMKGCDISVCVEWDLPPQQTTLGAIAEAAASTNAAGIAYKAAGGVVNMLKNRSQVPLPPCEGQTYIVRVTVHKARNLQAIDADKRYDPLTEISLLNVRKETDYSRKTNNPMWEEEIFLMFEKVGAGFWAEPFTMTVLDHRIGIPNEVIGVAVVDVGTIYSCSASHNINKKWFPIIKSTTNGLVMGYIKVSITILNAKTDPVPDLAEGEDEDEDDDDDVVANLIDLPGARFDEIGLVARIVEAESLPAMDKTILSDAADVMKKTASMVGIKTQQKDLCDPYIKIIHGKSSLTTPPMQNSYNPKWDCVRSLNMLVPSMTPFIQIMAWDQDLGPGSVADDLIATVKVDARTSHRPRSEGVIRGNEGTNYPYLALRWYNLYGSNDNNNSKYCQKQARGEIDGSTFRGRVLLGFEGIPKEFVDHRLLVMSKESYEERIVTLDLQIRFLMCTLLDSGSYFFSVNLGKDTKKMEKVSGLEMSTRTKERNAMHFLPNIGGTASGVCDLNAKVRVVIPAKIPDETPEEAEHRFAEIIDQIPDVVIHLHREERIGSDLYAYYRIPASQLLKVQGGHIQCVQMHRNFDQDSVGEGELVRSALLQFYSGMAWVATPDIETPPGVNLKVKPWNDVANELGIGRQRGASVAHRAQLRAYIYQCRFLPAADDNGLADPYVKFVFGTGWMKSQYVLETLSPTFNETLVIDVADPQPPHSDVILEVWDWDQIGSDDFLGRVAIPYTVAMDPSNVRQYKWYDLVNNKGQPITRTVGNETKTAQIMVAFETVTIRGNAAADDSILPPKAKVPRKRGVTKGPLREIITIPPDMAVRTQVYSLDLFIIGLRNMKKFEFLELQAPTVEFEISGYTYIVPKAAVSCANANFMHSKDLQLELPSDSQWIPPLCIQVFDHRLGRKVLVGSAYLDITEKIFDPTYQKDVAAAIEAQRKLKLDEMRKAKKISFAVKKEQKLSLKTAAKTVSSVLSISPRSKESQAQQQAQGSKGPSLEAPLLQHPDEDDDDAATPHGKPVPPLKAPGKKTTVQSFLTKNFEKALGMKQKQSQALDIPDVDHAEYIAGITKVEELPWFDRFDPPNSLRGCDVEHIVTRIHKHHIHCSIPEMVSMPTTCESLYGPFDDGAISVDLKRGQGEKNLLAGQVKMSMLLNRAVSSSSNNSLTELPTRRSLNESVNYLLRVYIIVCTDLAAKDESILGSASDPYIKLTLGSGVGQKPTRVITDKENKKFATLNPEFFLMYEMNGSLPRDSVLQIEVYDWDQVGFDELIGSTEISLEDRWYSAFGYKNNGIPLGGRYTEKRNLHDRKGALQGRIEMWVDMFPMNSVIPPAIKITPPPPIPLELRVVIWNTRDVIMQDKSIHGEAMTDIYVRSWLKGFESMAQETDVHYRSLDGQGNFNWRMLFPLVYFTRNKKVSALTSESKSFSLFRVRKEIKPWKPEIYLQLYDDDLLPGTDDFIGECVVNLTNIQPSLTRRTQSGLLDSIISDAFMVCQWWPFNYCFDSCKKSEAGGTLSLEERQELAKLEQFNERNARNEQIEKIAKERLSKESKNYDALSPAEKINYLKRLKPELRNNLFKDFEEKRKQPDDKTPKDDAEGSGNAPTTIFESPRYWFACTAPNGGNRVGDIQVSFQLVRLKEDGTVADKKHEAGKGRSEPNKLPEPKRPDSSFFWLSNPFKSAVHILWKNYKWYMIAIVCFAVTALFVYVFVETGISVKATRFFT